MSLQMISNKGLKISINQIFIKQINLIPVKLINLILILLNSLMSRI